MTSFQTIDKVLDSFPLTSVPAIVGEPNYDSLNDVVKVLKTNAASVQTERGGGELGHLVLTVEPAKYVTIA